MATPPSPPASSSSVHLPEHSATAATKTTPALERILSTYLLRVDTNTAAAAKSLKGKERQHSAGLALVMNEEDTPPSPISPTIPGSAVAQVEVDEDKDMLKLILEAKRSEDQRLAAADALRVEEMRRSNLKAEIWLLRQRQERESRSISVAPKREHSRSISRSPSPSGAYITPRASFAYRTPSVDNVVIKAEPEEGRFPSEHYRPRASYPPINEPSGPIGAAFALRYAGASAAQQSYQQHHLRPRGTPLPPPPPAGYGYAPHPHHHHGYPGYSYGPAYPPHAVAAASSRSASTSSVHARSVSPRMPAAQEPMTPESERDGFSPVATRKRQLEEVDSADEESEDEKDAEDESKGPLSHEEVMKQLRRKLRRNAKQRLQASSASPAASTPAPASPAKSTAPRSRSLTTSTSRATIAAAAAARAKAMRTGTCVKPSSAASSSESWRPESLKTARTSDVRGE